MTTKDQERKAVEKIRKIVEELGENSYVGFAEEYKKQKANRSRYRKVMEELDKRERRRAGRE